MAFGLQWLTRIEQSPNLDKTLNPGQGMDSVLLPQMWAYNASASGANDSAATVEGANYFLTAGGYLQLGDFINVITNDPGYHILNVTTRTQNATTGVISVLDTTVLI